MLRRLVEQIVKPKRIVVVSGLPRSGTSMMMQMLHAGGLRILADEQRQSDVNNPKGYFEFTRVKKLRDGDVSWLADAHGQGVKIISALLHHLPHQHHYQIIFMQRDMREILQSQRKMLASLGEPADRYTEAELTQRYQAHVQTVLDWLDQQDNVNVLVVNYHEVLDNAHKQAARIERFLQSGLDVQAMAAAVDADLYRNKTIAGR